ncbi:MAG TPA: hypothetical protein VMF30_01655, partial [Pirellulales bacterium]|nr:hypothetical protein [Pirellulales bacterium]
VTLFEGLRHESERVQDQLRSKQIAYDEAIGEAFRAAWSEWLAPCDAIEAAIRSFEAQGIRLRSATPFRQCVRELKLQPSDPAAMGRADQNLLAGHGISLDEALGGLRTDCRP